MTTLQTLREDMSLLIQWAKAYEQGEQEVEDYVYDALVRSLAEDQKHCPDLWDVACVEFPAFNNNDWRFTGSFYHGELK